MRFARPLLIAVLSFVIGFLLAGCEQRRLVDTEIKEYTLVDVRPPKRFYITLMDKKTGQVYKNLYVSKRCSAWKKAVIGKSYRFVENTYAVDGVLMNPRPSVSGFCTYLKNNP